MNTLEKAVNDHIRKKSTFNIHKIKQESTVATDSEDEKLSEDKLGRKNHVGEKTRGRKNHHVVV